MNEVRLYRFYNTESHAKGEPFALCDECAKVQKLVLGCTLLKIADRALLCCYKCGAMNPEEEP
jgi:hypothetical protein